MWLFGRTLPSYPQSRSHLAYHRSSLAPTLPQAGRTARTLRRRWYYLQQNVIYWFSNHTDRHPKGALFIEGSHVVPVTDEAAEAKGYHCFRIDTSSEHGDRNRVLYAHGRAARDSWLAVLRRACRAVPFDEEYELGAEIGFGRFSRVFIARRRDDGTRFAVKVIHKASLSEAERELLRTEIAILRLVAHPHIVRLEAVFEDSHTMNIVMEYLEGGELFNNIVGRARFSEVEARELMKPLVESVSYLHSLGIVHRDIKPENMLCSRKGVGADGGGGCASDGSASDGSPFGAVKIADFGLSKLVHPGEVMTMACGTLQYCAPEVLSRAGYGKEADLWSLGVIMHLVVRGKLPFDDPDKDVVISRTLQASVDFAHPVWLTWSAAGLDFVRGLLERDPAKRLTARRALQHPWFRGPGEVGSALPAAAVPGVAAAASARE